MDEESGWSRVASTYGQVGPTFFQDFGKSLVDRAPMNPGDAVLDVACGRGAVLFPAMDRVGPTGSVTAIDFSEGMVRETAADLASRGLNNARVMKMDAQHLEFEDSTFDAVLCGFAIFFFPDLQKAMSEFRRVLKPGGALVVSTLGPHDLFWDSLFLFRPDMDSESQFDTAAKMSKHFTQAGFEQVTVEALEGTSFYRDEDEWWATLWSHGLRIVLEKIAPEVLEQVHAHTFDELSRMKRVDGIFITEDVLITTGRKWSDSVPAL